ncbi:MAG: amidohydrolase family protein [Candidatus Heimdallarchaeota archaeon]|nr:amidohydrolase family protein [Candidatus Heimdallarchaeota archaeon]
MSIKIDADTIITGNGEIIQDSCIVIEDKTISYVGPKEAAPKAAKTLTSPVLMPGMWDTHAHFAGMYTANLENTVFTKATLAILRSTWDTREALKAGFTTIREVGGQGIDLNKAIAEGVIVGPRIYAAGKILTATGGHADIHNAPLDMVLNLGDQGLGIICDGVDECYRAVRMQLREGAELIKFCASGGVMSKIDHPIHQQFSQEEQKAIVDEANRAEVAVAAHCHGGPGIRAALEAGVTTIDHGTYLTEELADLMIEKGAILVPTRYVIEKLLHNAANMGVPQYAIDKLNALADQHWQALKMAIRKGVKIAIGTDMFTSGPGNLLTWGENAMELKYMVDAGMTPMQAIVAATGDAPLTLGKRAPKSGMIKEGYEADVLLLQKNPLENIEYLLEKEHMRVIKQGKLIEF